MLNLSFKFKTKCKGQKTSLLGSCGTIAAPDSEFFSLLLHDMEKHFQEERGNSVTHLIGVLFALSSLSLLLLAEGVFYTSGTYFYARDLRRHYHTIWHIFVLLGALAHWGAVLTIMLGEMAKRG